MSNLTLREISILRLQTENVISLVNVMLMSIANKLMTVIPMANALCRLALISPVITYFKWTVFQQAIKLIKNHLRTITMNNCRLNDLIILDSEKDILDNID